MPCLPAACPPGRAVFSPKDTRWGGIGARQATRLESTSRWLFACSRRRPVIPATTRGPFHCLRGGRRHRGPATGGHSTSGKEGREAGGALTLGCKKAPCRAPWALGAGESGERGAGSRGGRKREPGFVVSLRSRGSWILFQDSCFLKKTKKFQVSLLPTPIPPPPHLPAQILMAKTCLRRMLGWRRRGGGAGGSQEPPQRPSGRRRGLPQGAGRGSESRTCWDLNLGH